MTGQSLEHRPAKTISICDSDILDTKKRHRYLCRFFVSKISENVSIVFRYQFCRKELEEVDRYQGKSRPVIKPPTSFKVLPIWKKTSRRRGCTLPELYVCGCIIDIFSSYISYTFEIE